MPDLPDAPSPWQLPAASGPAPAHNAAAAQSLRSQVLRSVILTMVVVAVLAVGGIVAAGAYGSWALLIGAGVAVFSIAAILIAASRITSAVRTHVEWLASAAPVREVRTPNPVEPVHPSMFDNDPDQRREVFGKLARRLQSLVNRAIQRVDSMEREIEDPDLLRGLYEIDHLATRVRRQAENLAVLGGGTPQRRSNQPVSVYAVLRSAVAEIEHYKQVSIVPLEGHSIHGHAVAEIIHLLAELLENATTFTAPDAPKVVLRVHKVTAGLAIEIQDRGLGMTPDDLQRINRLLDGSATIDLAELLSDGRIGLAVVKELARRHGVRVQAQTNIFGGIDAAVVIPNALLGESVEDPASAAASALTQSLPPHPQPPQQPTQPRPPQHQAGPKHQATPQPDDWEAQQPVAAAYPGPVTINVPPAVSPFNAWQDASSGQGNEPSGYPPSPQPSALPVRTPGSSTPQPAAEFVPADSPELPVRTPRGSTPQPAAEFAPADSADALPPLPQRRGSHLRPELLQAPAPTTPLLGHNTNLMAVVQQGFERARDAQQSEAHHLLKQHRTTEGDSEAWPTT